MRHQLGMLGIELDTSAAGGHVARIERRIQMVKERARAHICGRLPFTLTNLGNTMLVLYCVSRINCQQSGSRPGGLSPRELFSGRRVDGSKDFRAAFGDYAVCTTPKTNSTMASRTEDCIVMLPTGNRTGSVKMLSLTTGHIVTRDQFKILPMPQSIIQALNAMALKEGKKINKTQAHVFDEMLYANSVDKSNMPEFITNPPTQGDRVERTARVNEAVEAQPQPVIADLPTADTVIEAHHTAVGGEVQAIPELNYPDLVCPPAAPYVAPYIQSPQNAAPHEGVPAHDVPPIVVSTEEVAQPAPTTPQHTGAATEPSEARSVIEFFRTGEGAFVTDHSVRTRTEAPAAFVHSIGEVLERHRHAMGKNDTSNISVREALRTRGDEAARVIKAGLQQMIDKRVWVPVLGSRITSAQRSAIIRSSMFLKRKNNPDGSFLKLKARLVAGGDQQDKELYDDLSSPTVSTSAVFTLLAVSAFEKRQVSVVDISGAFLNADMRLGVPVHMRLDRTMTNFITTIDNRYKKYVDAGGGVVVPAETWSTMALMAAICGPDFLA